MASTTQSFSTTELDRNAFKSGTAPFAEKYQTLEAYWTYSPDVSVRTPNAKGRSTTGKTGFDLSATGGEYTDTLRVNQNSLIWKVRLRTEVRKVYLDPQSTQTVHFAPMNLDFSAFETDSAGIEYGATDAPNGLGLRGRILTASTTAYPASVAASSPEDIGFVCRVPWDDRVHSVTSVDSGYLYNAVTIAKPVAQLLDNHGEPHQAGSAKEGWAWPFARNVSQGGPNPDGTYSEQNADRIWNTSWHVNGGDLDTTNDWIPSTPHAGHIWSLFVSPIAGTVGFDPVMTRRWPTGDLDQITEPVRGLSLIQFADDSVYYDTVFPRPSVGIDWDAISVDINEGIDKASAAWAAVNTTNVREAAVKNIVKAAANGHLFADGLLHGIDFKNATPPSEDMKWSLVPMTVADAEAVVEGSGATELQGPSSATAAAYMANAGVSIIGESHASSPTRDWASFWTDLVPDLS